VKVSAWGTRLLLGGDDERVNDEGVKWLRQQVQARLALAREASPKTDGHWWRRTSVTYINGPPEPVGALYAGEPFRDEDGEVACGDYIVVYDEGAPSGAQFEHIAANDPRDVIARCEAELAILDEHYILWTTDSNEAYEEFSVVRIGGADRDHGCVCCHYYGQGGVKGYGICRTVRAVASAYRHREGYAEHWGT
jgi:hypothetical protein